jgi:hypothetical protein
MPYASSAQRRFFNSPAGKKKVGAATVAEFNQASKGQTDKMLPNHVTHGLRKAVKARTGVRR